MIITPLKLSNGKTIYLAQEKTKLVHICLSGDTRAKAIGRVLKELMRPI